MSECLLLELEKLKQINFSLEQSIKRHRQENQRLRRLLELYHLDPEAACAIDWGPGIMNFLKRIFKMRLLP